MKPMEEKVKEMEAQLKGWAASIDEFTANAQKSNGWASIDLRQSIDDLKIKRALLRSKLNEFEVSGSAGRKKMSKDLERAWKDLEEAFTKLERFGRDQGPDKECK